jgi:hypothetical protein
MVTYRVRGVDYLVRLFELSFLQGLFKEPMVDSY